MAHRVFISYSSKDKAAADALVHTLENAGVRCWYAPRDILSGEDWASAIISAISCADLFLLVFSKDLNASKQVYREVSTAAGHELPILPVRIENRTPSGGMAYYLETVHWLDTITPPFQKQLDTVVARVKEMLGESQTPVPTPQQPPNKPQPQNKPQPSVRPERNKVVLALVGALSVLAVGLLLFILLQNRSALPAAAKDAAITAAPTAAPMPTATPTFTPAPTKAPTPTPTATPMPEPTPEPTPEPVDEAGLTASERALFNAEAGTLGHTSLINKRNVPWRPAVDAQSISKRQGCYGWIAVRSMELDAAAFSAEYVEFCVAPGVTVTIKGEIPAGKDFHVEKDAELIIDGNIYSNFSLCNDGTTIINGAIPSEESNLIMNRGTLVVNGMLSDKAHVHSFLGSVTEGYPAAEYHDFVPPYECAGGKYGMWAYIHVLLGEQGAKFPW